MIQKPIELMMDDTKTGIYQLLNNSGLSVVIINMILKEIYEDVNNQATKSLKAIRADYSNKVIREMEEMEERERRKKEEAVMDVELAVIEDASVKDIY